MANLQFDSTVTHNGRIFRGPVIRDNLQLSPGMIIDPTTDTSKPALTENGIIQGLIDRKLAHYTNDPATHSAVLVNGAQEAIPLDAPLGSGLTPAAQLADAKQPAQPDGFPQHPAPAQTQQQPPVQAPAPSKQPTAEEIAATAATVK